MRNAARFGTYADAAGNLGTAPDDLRTLSFRLASETDKSSASAAAESRISATVTADEKHHVRL
jgi:hypothetical protein